MRVFFRTDSSVVMGSGHLMRCLTLADHLRRHGAECRFICRDLPGNLCHIIRDRHFDLSLLPTGSSASTATPSDYRDWLGVTPAVDAEETARCLHADQGPGDWLVVDHYALAAEWEQAMRGLVRHVMVIDDLANRRHECDILLDQNLNDDSNGRYDSLLPEHCRRLLGPPYALLREEFYRARVNVEPRTGQVSRLLVFFGGTDADNVTATTLKGIFRLNRPDLAVEVIIGAGNPHREKIERLCTHHDNIICRYNIADMAERMAAADLAIGAGGTTTWERAWLGLPTIAVILADNQIPGTIAAARAGILWNLGFHDTVKHTDIALAVKQALDSPDDMRRMSRAALALFGDDARPGIERVFETMKEVAHVVA